MKSIIEYQSYRQYMQDFYDFKKRTSVFSWREFSKLAGFISPNYLKQVCEREANLSRVGIHKVAEPKQLAKKCHQETNADEVEKSLNFLVQTGLLQKTEPHTYRQIEKNLTGSTESMAVAMRSMNRDMAKIAEEAIDRFSVEERNFTGITMGVSDGAYAKIVTLLRECRNKIVEVVSYDKKMDRVYRLNMQLFPLTERVQEESGENNA